MKPAMVRGGEDKAQARDSHKKAAEMGIIDSFEISQVCLTSTSSLLVVANTPVDFSQIHTINLTLCNFSNDSPWTASNNRETRYDHIRRHNCSIQNLDIVFDDCEFANNAIGPNIDVASYKRCFDNRSWPDEDMVCDLEGVM